jgi:hypothetical protein
MSNPLMRVITSPWVGLIAMVMVIVLGLALTATSLTAARTEATLRGRIAAMAAENRQTAAVWGAKLAACEAAAPAVRGDRVTAATLSDAARAQQLAQNAPAGFDVCARMESADQAVLETLK